MKSKTALVALASSLALVLSSSLASATPNFPAALESDLSLGYTPPCSVCHVGPQNSSTATTAFVMALRGYGLVANDTGSLSAALAGLAATSVDSDCNGILDGAQLKEGRDPSSGAYIDGSGKTAPAEPGCGNSSSSGPTYGCGARIAPSSAPWQGALLVAAVLAATLVRRRR